MNSKAKMKKNMVRLVALLLAAMVVIGMIAATTNTGEMVGRGHNYSEGLTKEGFFKDLTASEYITLPDCSTFEMPKALTETTDDAVQSEIDKAVAQFATQEKDTDTSRVAEKGDKVNIDYTGTVDGVEFEGGKAAGYDLTLGSNAFIPGFEDAVIGHKTGENFDINVTFPEDYGTEGTERGELNGKAAVFNITINHMYTTNTPEFNDEFVKENYGEIYSSAQEMRDDYRKLIIEDQMMLYAQSMLYSGSDVIEYPQAATEFFEDYLVANIEAQAAQYGWTAEDLLALSGVESVEAYIESNKEAIEEYVKMHLMNQAYCEKEGLTVSDEYLEEYLKETFGEQDTDAIVTFYGKPYMKFSLLQQIVVDDLIEKMPVVDILPNESTDAPAEDKAE